MLIKTTEGWRTLEPTMIHKSGDNPKPDLTPDWIKFGFSSFDAWLDAWGRSLGNSNLTHFPSTRWDNGFRW